MTARVEYAACAGSIVPSRGSHFATPPVMGDLKGRRGLACPPPSGVADNTHKKSQLPRRWEANRNRDTFAMGNCASVDRDDGEGITADEWLAE